MSRADRIRLARHLVAFAVQSQMVLEIREGVGTPGHSLAVDPTRWDNIEKRWIQWGYLASRAGTVFDLLVGY